MTSHWPTFADGKFWCACDNRTFDSEEEWQEHVVTEGFSARPHTPSRTRYTFGCRCEGCTEATRKFTAIRRQRLEDGTAIREHGTYQTYTGWGCRCDACRQANTDYQRAYQKRLRDQPSESSSGHAAPSR